MDKHKPMSASLIKTLTGCSYSYFAKYILRLPDTTNNGALRGSVCHNVFECLGKKRHKKHFNKVVRDGSIWKCKPISRYVLSYAKKNGIDDQENLDLVDFMIVAGLNYDFFAKEHFGRKPTASFDEIDFDITVDEGNKSYRIRGFIDKLFLFKKEKVALIRDFKSSKKVFEGDEIDDNIQDLMYRLAVKKLYPEYDTQEMEFVFLKFDCSKGGDGIIKTPNASAAELDGFEYYLTELQQQVNNFDEKAAKSDYAYHKGFPEKHEGFSKRLLCGFSKKPGHLKKDGTLMWSCSCKWSFDYYEVTNLDGEKIRGLHIADKDGQKKYKALGYTLKKKKYGGCPVWNKNTENDVFL